jgi:hypothetical protein
MMEPINYLQNVADPFAQALSGLKFGQVVAAQQQEQELIKQKQLQQQQYQQAILRLQSPTATAADFENVMMISGKDQAETLKNVLSARTTRENQLAIGRVAPIAFALKTGNPDQAISLMNQERDAAINSGDSQDAQYFSKMIELAKTQPENVGNLFATKMTLIPGGKDALDNLLKLTAERRAVAEAPFKLQEAEAKAKGVDTGQTISTPAAKQAAGLVDPDGKPLPGTFFVKPGQAPTLVKGEVAPEVKKGYTVLTPAEAKAKGLPTAGYTWQFNQDTNDISALVKPQQAAVQVNIPGQPRPPTRLEEEIDKKFAPLAVDWMAGEKTKAASRINQLNAVLNILQTQKRITNPVLGLTPDVVQSFVSAPSREARANAERVIQEGMRAILGAQFTRAEGEAFLARSYDPKAPQADNARRLRSIVTQMQESAKDREAMVKYMQGPGEGSLKGYTGRIPSIDDFYAAIEEKAPVADAPQPSAPAVTSPAKAAAINAAVEKYRSK